MQFYDRRFAATIKFLSELDLDKFWAGRIGEMHRHTFVLANLGLNNSLSALFSHLFNSVSLLDSLSAYCFIVNARIGVSGSKIDCSCRYPPLLVYRYGASCALLGNAPRSWAIVSSCGYTRVLRRCFRLA